MQKPILDALCYAFIISGVDIFEKNDKRWQAFRFGGKIIFYITSVVGLLTGTFHFGFFLDEFHKDLFSPIIFCYLGLLFNFTLHWKKDVFVQIAEKLSKHNMRRKHIYIFSKKTKKCMIMLSFNLITCLILVMISIYMSLTVDNTEALWLEYPMWTSILQNIFPNLIKIRSSLLYFTVFFCCYLPTISYITAYEVISYYLKELLIEVKDKVIMYPTAVKSHHKMYSSIKLLVEFVDLKLKYLNCFVILVFGSQVYFFLFCKMQNIFHFQGHSLIDSIFIINSVLLAIKTINESGSIPIINQKILTTVCQLSMDDNLLLERLIFLNQIQQGLCLTVGGMIALTKGWPLILTGSVLTYSLLIKSL